MIDRQRQDQERMLKALATGMLPKAVGDSWIANGNP